MEPIFEKQFHIEANHVDCFGQLKPSAILYFVQETAGAHCQILDLSWEKLLEKHLFWAIIRHRVQITRLPQQGETITVETWPMPTTRTAFPRSVIARDEKGRELFRSISLWVLMDPETRAMILPGKSGISVPGILRGNELTAPGGLIPGQLSDSLLRNVRFTDLDLNGHMNNGRYLDWIADLLPSAFHRQHQPREFTLYYHAEAREGDLLAMQWSLSDSGSLRVDVTRQDQRIFSALVEY